MFFFGFHFHSAKPWSQQKNFPRMWRTGRIWLYHLCAEKLHFFLPISFETFKTCKPANKNSFVCDVCLSVRKRILFTFGYSVNEINAQHIHALVLVKRHATISFFFSRQKKKWLYFTILIFSPIFHNCLYCDGVWDRANTHTYNLLSMWWYTNGLCTSN